MNRERFIRQRKQDWQNFESLLARMKKTRVTQWNGSDVNTSVATVSLNLLRPVSRSVS